METKKDRMRNKKRVSILVGLSLLAASCSIRSGAGVAVAHPSKMTDSIALTPTMEGGQQQTSLHNGLVEQIIAQGKTLLGKPYRYRGACNWPLDCSGFVSFIYGSFNIKLPRSSAEQHRYTLPLKRAEAQPGDLIFFKGRNARGKRVGHVAMIIAVEEDDIVMMHSSCAKGIVVERLKGNCYYERRFVGIGRVAQLIKEPTSSLSFR